ncbi:MAG: PaaI family thioesterase [Desulfovibrio sp.]|jgi:uncharacterized protein (TIGR00369 family)|nr:PaaI family thioesterase [Desulfovibrio sp.]
MAMRNSRSLCLADIRAAILRDPLAAWIHFYLENLDPGRVFSRMRVEEKHLAPTGFLHASVLTAFADISCGLGTFLALPDEDHTFATLEIKTNFLRTLRQGEIHCAAHSRHKGGATQVWDAEVRDPAAGTTLILFRCTQMILDKRRLSGARGKRDPQSAIFL